MKKMSFVLSTLVVAGLLLAACAGPTNNNAIDTPVVGVTDTFGTPAGDVTLQPTVDTGLETTGTPAIGDNLTGTPAVDETGTPTLDTGLMTATPAAGVDMTQTPIAGVPGEEHNFVLLSELLRMRVSANDGMEVGMVNGVMVDRGIAVTGGSELDFSSTPGAQAGAAQATRSADLGTPTVDAGALGTPTAIPTLDSSASVDLSGPRITFVLVNVTGASDVSDTSGSVAGQTATPALGKSDTGTNPAQAGAVLIPWEAFELSAQAGTAGMDTLTLNSDVDADVIAGAPRFDDTMAETVVGDDVIAYWNDEGMGIPVTGGAAADTILIRGNFGSVNVTDESGKTIAQVRDLVVDMNTGELEYVLISGGSAFGNREIMVPINHLLWQPGQGQGAGSGNLGEFRFNFDAGAFDTAPDFIGDLTGDWNLDVDTYWQEINPDSMNR